MKTPMQELKELVLIRRNEAHINCFEEKKEAYNDVLNLIESLLPEEREGNRQNIGQILNWLLKHYNIGYKENEGFYYSKPMGEWVQIGEIVDDYLTETYNQ